VLDRTVLRPLVLVLLVAAGAFIAVKRPGNAPAGPPPSRPMLITGVVALLIGAYDGFFGPGTGTFLIIAFVTLLKSSLPQATADAKVVNFASNLATVVLLGLKGKVLWAIALPMAVGQFAGSLVGASMAIKGGARIIRAVVLAVVAGLVAKLAYDLLTT
jgi:uncharacterized membrane protein YfcA